MKTSTLGLSTASLILLGFLSVTSTVHAAEVPGESKDTQTEVKIIDSPDPAVLKLIHVPEQYKFETKLKSNGAYEINGGIVEKNNTITVFNDKSTQDWSVKASIDNTQLSSKSGKTATVTGFKINGQSLMGETSNPIVQKAAEKKTFENNTGNISKDVVKDGLNISFNNEKHDLKAGDVLTGTVHYQLYNTPDAK